MPALPHTYGSLAERVPLDSHLLCCVLLGDETLPLTGEYSLAGLQKSVERLAERGLRVLAFAMKVGLL